MTPNPSQAAKRRPTPVTLIIGIKCQDAVVLASDSQITYGNTKRTDGTKIQTVYFSDMPILVAQAGSLVMSGRFVDIFSELAKCTTPAAPENIGVMAQNAMRTLRNELREVHFNCSSEELNDIFLKQGTECEIMLGFFMHGNAHIYTVDLRLPVYQKSTFYYEAIGCGAPLGQYLLAEHATPLMEKRFASLIAIYVVEIVKKHDAFCGGPTKVSFIQKDHGVGFGVCGYSQAAIDKAASKLFEADAITKPERIKMLHDKILSEEFRPFDVLDFDFEN